MGVITKREQRFQVHKVQALSIKHLVLGSLEGVFAHGQVYVMLSRVTDPRNFVLLGLPPKDLVEDVAQGLIRRGIDVHEYFEDACKVTGEWQYDRTKAKLIDRFHPKFSKERTIPPKWRTLAECLNPQPEAQVNQAGG